MKPRRPKAPPLPEWASAYFRVCRERFDLEMPHRRDAFNRLACDRDADMQSVWKHIDETELDKPKEEIIGALIYSTDTVIFDEEIPRYGLIQAVTAGRLTPKQIKARKLAKLLRDLFCVTPQHCDAFRKRDRLLTDIENLCNAFYFRLDAHDLDACRRKHDIEFIADSKRGFIQHRHASDKIRGKAIKVAQHIIEATDTPAWCAERLAGLVKDLLSWSSFKQEHGDETEYRSQKASWCDWVRVARERIDAPPEMLTHDDWATLVRVLFDVEVDRQSVGRIINER